MTTDAKKNDGDLDLLTISEHFKGPDEKIKDFIKTTFDGSFESGFRICALLLCIYILYQCSLSEDIHVKMTDSKVASPN